MIRFMEENGYDVTYVSQADVSASGGAAMLEKHKVFLDVGHSEYWDPGGPGQRNDGQECRRQSRVLRGQSDVVEDPMGG